MLYFDFRSNANKWRRLAYQMNKLMQMCRSYQIQSETDTENKFARLLLLSLVHLCVALPMCVIMRTPF